MTMLHLTFALAVFFLIASPGPVVALVISDARQAWPTATITGGVLSAQLLLLITLTLIYTALDVSPTLLNWGQLVGGLYLAWLGINSLLSSADGVATVQNSQRHFFWRALKVGLSNPKDILFFLAFLPGFIEPDGDFIKQGLVLALIWGVIDVTILLVYGAISRQLLPSVTAQKIMAKAPSLFLLGIGLLSMLMGTQRLIQG
ncbi:LysE family translocator [Pseudomonas tolaasii]|uniref:LysE family translocator n=2 Tax=Pseudomonas tolaasii TaxID=29442 RepID=A0A7Y8ASB8_PSETO|nr:LysE family translocator [Pseudomonas tolaasii]ARB30352.1 lysine transporter LysE [Pseudomonas tolaasii]KAB0468707.1 LysE family translocator [Pseudomonas tolaasii]MBW1249114.1 LysE family translocator [Pseudomonas tolaasii]MBW4794950.1 LysE family translocator [Pseudomonas tolaasii]MBY8941737.1 LysE family translocator [Pseudomonas tolaasii]